jgi:uncharacterized protein YidB (DUF937 family)
MIDQLIKLVEQNAGDAIVKNKEVPDQFNHAAIENVAGQIFEGLKGQVSQGNMQQVASMFKGGGSSALSGNPMVTQIISSITTSMASKFGVSGQTAQNIASTLIPQVLNQFVDKTNNPNDGDFDLQDMMRNFSGSDNLDIGDILGKFSGGSSQQGPGGPGNALGKLFGNK